MLAVMTLLSLLNSASAQAFHTETLAVAPQARAALVRVHSNGYVTMALCGMPRFGSSTLTFKTVESIAGCRPGRVRVADTPEGLARFDHELEQIAQTIVTKNEPARGRKHIAGYGLVGGGGASAIAYALAPRPIRESLKRYDRLAFAVVVGYFASNASLMLGLSRAIRAGDRSNAATNAVTAWARNDESSQIIYVASQSTWSRVLDMVDEAMARAGEPDPTYLR